MSGFDEHKDGLERKSPRDEGLRFKATARRNKLFGLWAAEQLGKAGAEATAYAKSVVMSDFEEAGDADVLRKVQADLAAAGKQVTDADLAEALNGRMQQAIDDIQAGR